MALYSSRNSFFADLIAAGISSQKYIDILNQLIGPAIGEVKLTLDNSRPVLAKALGYIDLNKAIKEYSDGFDGWVYANGAKIYKKQFPEAYEFFMHSSYPGKQTEGDTENNYAITIPNLYKFIKINVKYDDPSISAINEYDAQYSTPNHTHKLGAIVSNEDKDRSITVQKSAWIWSTTADKKGKGGKMPPYNFNGVNIPESPSAHQGRLNTFHHYVDWDVPVDVNLNITSTPFQSTTTLQQKINNNVPLDGPPELYYPMHIKVPVLIFIGRKQY